MRPAFRSVAIGIVAVAAIAAPAVADNRKPAPTAAEGPTWITPQSVRGTGKFVLHGPNVEGDQITFQIDGRTARTGITHGTFRFQHHKPPNGGDPGFTSYGDGEVTCLRVTGRTAILTAVIANEFVPGHPEGIGPHAYYLRITDGHPDTVTFTQAPPPPGVAGCTDPLNFASVDTSPLTSGTWTLHGLPG